jgi:MFS superfamily sulfate permease-like transporter
MANDQPEGVNASPEPPKSSELPPSAAASSPGVTTIVLDLETVPAVDLTATKMLDELEASLAATGQTIVYTRNVGQVRDVLRADGAGDAVVYPTIAAAVEASKDGQPGQPDMTDDSRRPDVR